MHRAPPPSPPLCPRSTGVHDDLRNKASNNDEAKAHETMRTKRTGRKCLATASKAYSRRRLTGAALVVMLGGFERQRRVQCAGRSVASLYRKCFRNESHLPGTTTMTPSMMMMMIMMRLLPRKLEGVCVERAACFFAGSRVDVNHGGKWMGFFLLFNCISVFPFHPCLLPELRLVEKGLQKVFFRWVCGAFFHLLRVRSLVRSLGVVACELAKVLYVFGREKRETLNRKEKRGGAEVAKGMTGVDPGAVGGSN